LIDFSKAAGMKISLRIEGGVPFLVDGLVVVEVLALRAGEPIDPVLAFLKPP
jgi:hypothetical protein